MESRFLEPPKGSKIGSRNRRCHQITLTLVTGCYRPNRTPIGQDRKYKDPHSFTLTSTSFKDHPFLYEITVGLINKSKVVQLCLYSYRKWYSSSQWSKSTMKWYMKWIIYELRIWNQVKLWSSQLWTQFLQLGALNVSGFFIAQLVRASHRYREVTGSNPVEVLNFSSFFTQLQKLRS